MLRKLAAKITEKPIKLICLGWRRLSFMTGKFFATLAYRRRIRKRFNTRFPVTWLTPKAIMTRDLDLYEPDNDKFELNYELLKEVVADRNDLNQKIWRTQIASAVMYLFLLSSYLSVDLSFEFIIKMEKKFLGIKELLILSSAILGGYTMILQNNKHTLDNFILYIIEKKVPLEIQYVFKSRYFIDKSITRYVPTNLPYLNVTKLNSAISGLPLFFLLFSMLALIVAIIGINYVVLHDIWITAELGTLSRIVVIVTTIVFTFGLLYLISMQLPLPYRDYSLLEKMTVLPTISQRQYEREFGNFYEEDRNDLENMKRRGFMKSDTQA